MQNSPYAPLDGLPANPAGTSSRTDVINTTTPVPASAAGSTELEKTSPESALPRKVPFYKRRRFIISSIIGNCIGIAILFIMLFPVVKAIIQDVVNGTTIDVTLASISNPTNTSFQLLMQATVAHTSTISAVISFKNPVNVSWIDDSTNVPLGYMQLSTLYTKNQRATINQTTTFYITDQNAFGRFSSAIVASQNFTWQLQSSDLSVQAEKFPVAHGVSFNKMVVINGINNFANNVQTKELQLPGGNITEGISFTTVIQLSNPSPFELDIGTVVVDLFFQGVYLGNATSLNTHLSRGNTAITSDAVFIPQPTLYDIAVVSQLVTNYLGHQTSFITANGQSVVLFDGTAISWLSQGIKNLTLTVPLLSTTPISPFGSTNTSSEALESQD